jgi:hypothetical protein
MTPRFSEFYQVKTTMRRKMYDADFLMYDADFPIPDLETIHRLYPIPDLETIYRLYPMHDLEGNPLPNPYDGDKIRARSTP